MTPPAGYVELEQVLRAFERGDGNHSLAEQLDRIALPQAQRAARLLRCGRRAGAEAVLEEALEQLAGPENGNGLAWFDPRSTPQPEAQR